MHFAVIGLGNPGCRYHNTRHNMGFMVVDYLAILFKAAFIRGKGPYDLCQIQHQEYAILLIKPMTYMNRSGIAVDDVAKRFGLQPARILVVSDDLALPFGKLRLRKSGSAGGHNGLTSIINYLHSDQFPRLKLGVDTEEKKDIIEFVLSPFASTEKQMAEIMIRHACKAIIKMVEEGIERTMNFYNSNAFHPCSFQEETSQMSEGR